MPRVVQSFSVPDGSLAHHRLKAWKAEGANISARLQMLIEDSESPPTPGWPGEWVRPSAVQLERLSRVEMLLTDVDGVLTDARIERTADGAETRRFSVYDGHGLVTIHAEGWMIGAVSRENSEITRGRMEKFRMEEIHVGALDKAETIRDIRTRRELGEGTIVFVGDDVPDLAAFSMADFTFAPSTAHPIVRKAADIVCRQPGGDGAIREVCEILRAAKGIGPFADAIR